MTPLRLVLLSLGFTLVHIATSPERDARYALHQEMSLKEASFIIVYITQALAAPVITLTMSYYCCTQNSALVAGVLLCTSSFITESFRFLPAVHIFLAICMGVARALVDTSVLHIIAGKNTALPGTTGFSIWSATLGFSYAVAGMIMFFISDTDSISQMTDSVNDTNSNALTGDPNLAFSFAEMITPMVIYLIGGGFLVGATVKGKCDLKEKLIENASEPRKGAVRLNRRAYCAVGVMILFYGFMGSNLFQLFAVCSDSIGFQAQSLTCFGVAFTLMSLYVTYRGKSELDTSAILSTLLVIGFILTGVLFPVDCIAGEDFYMMGSSMMLIPMAGMFLGGGCGLLTCEVLSLVSMGWPTDYKYAALVSSQGLWAAASPFVPIDGWPRNFLVVMSILAVVYYFTAFYIHAVLKRFKKVRDRERLSYGAVDKKPKEIQSIPSSSATSDVIPV